MAFISAILFVIFFNPMVVIWFNYVISIYLFLILDIFRDKDTSLNDGIYLLLSILVHISKILNKICV